MPKDSNETEYILRGIPRAFWDQVKAKAERNRPPLRLNYLMLELLRQWVENAAINNPGAGPVPEAVTAALPKPKRVSKPKPKPTPVTVAKTAPVELPDLGGSF
jgi:hypothetical protein